MKTRFTVPAPELYTRYRLIPAETTSRYDGTELTEDTCGGIRNEVDVLRGT